MTAWVFPDNVRADVWAGLHNWVADDFRLVFSSVAPGTITQDHRFGAGGDIDISTGELTGGNVTAGGLPLDSKSVAGDPTVLDCADEVIAQDPSNPSVRYAYIFNNTDTGKRVIAFNDFGSAQDLSLGPTTVDMSNGALAVDGN